MIVSGFLIHSSDFLALIGLGYVLICQVKDEEKKKCSFENALVEKSESSTRNKNGLDEEL